MPMVTGVLWCARPMAALWLLFFFFFQAEDGIRDLIVTGVQTCALPISARLDHALGDDLAHLRCGYEIARNRSGSGRSRRLRSTRGRGRARTRSRCRL